MPPSSFSWLAHPALMGSALFLSVVAALASVILVPRYLASLPEDYLVCPEHHLASRKALVHRVGKNLLGVVLIALGAVMLILPGQGLITLLVGLMLLDFPGKQRLLQRLLGQRAVLRGVNLLRRRAGRAPLATPPSSSA